MAWPVVMFLMKNDASPGWGTHAMTATESDMPTWKLATWCGPAGNHSAKACTLGVAGPPPGEGMSVADTPAWTT